MQLPDAPPDTAALAPILALLRAGGVVVLSGAGCSTESGIPDYRGPETARRARNPIQFKAFVQSEAGRQRYWSRSLQGWPRIRDAAPNLAHLALAELEARGAVTHLVTQNVDRLHAKAGSRRVTELHGALAVVRCLGCGARSDRDALQARLLAANPEAGSVTAVEVAPDGDADLDAGAGLGFVVPGCEACGGALKPDVVFFGEAVPRDRVEAASEAVSRASALLVVGSSLAVFSGLRFVRQARALGLPTALLNLGRPARGADLFDHHADGLAGPSLAWLTNRLLPEGEGPPLAPHPAVLTRPR
jgi:NAD-dependent deacetylase sirtuin 4